MKYVFPPHASPGSGPLWLSGGVGSALEPRLSWWPVLMLSPATLESRAFLLPSAISSQDFHISFHNKCVFSGCQSCPGWQPACGLHLRSLVWNWGVGVGVWGGVLWEVGTSEMSASDPSTGGISPSLELRGFILGVRSSRHLLRDYFYNNNRNNRKIKIEIIPFLNYSPCAKQLIYIPTHLISKNFNEGCTIVISIVQIRKLGLRKVE